MKDLKWFAERVGKRIYRNPHPCCEHCDSIAEEGLIVSDKNHAEYLHMTQCDFANEGVFLDYRDEK